MSRSTRTRSLKRDEFKKKPVELSIDSQSCSEDSDEEYVPTLEAGKRVTPSVKEKCNKVDKSEEEWSNDDSSEDVHEVQCVPNGSKKIECYICNFAFDKILSLKQHMLGHKQEISFDTVNFNEMKIMKILNPHKRSIDSRIIQKFLMQEISENRYSQFYSIVNEYEKELHISDSETDNESTRSSYKCEICKATFDRRYKIYFHQKMSHNYDELFINCDYCSKKFVSMKLLIHHLKTLCENDEKPTPCTERFQKFLLQANLDHYANARKQREERKMKKLTEPPRKYLCTICNKYFSRQEHLNRHQAVHLPDEMKFQCLICSRRFNRKDNLRSHMKIHLDDPKPELESNTILCSYCGKSFGSKSNYVVHMRRHTGEKPYKCEFCDKAFPKSTDLLSHRVTHTKEKNYVCAVCNKAYARSAVLSKHMRIHHSPFNCIFCKKSFGKANSLKLHLRKHADSQAFLCKICGKCFEHEEDLHKHRVMDGHSIVRLQAAELAVEILSNSRKVSHVTEENICTSSVSILGNNDPLMIHGNETITRKTSWGPGNTPKEIIATNGSSVLLLPGGSSMEQITSEESKLVAYSTVACISNEFL